jgi:peptidoglycan DL-endopeptidase LytF
MAKPAPRRTIAHYGAPAAFLLAVTILAILIHSALGDGSTPGRPTTTLGPVTRPSTAKVPTQKTRTITNAQTSSTGTTAVAGAQYATVQTGDTYGSIAERYTTSVSELEALNPGVSSNSLQVGQRIRVE